jgi:serine/threonine-protein kinase
MNPSLLFTDATAPHSDPNTLRAAPKHLKVTIRTLKWADTAGVRIDPIAGFMVDNDTHFSDHAGPYELLASLGPGTRGEIYKAIDPQLNRTVVIKFLKGQESDHIKNQAKILAALNNPFICPIYEVSEDYVVMEYVEGKPISGPLSIEESINLAGQILSGLEAAHSKGIIHQGIKPANILVARGKVKLLDFGLTEQPPQRLNAGDAEAVSECKVGAMAYLSPEQALCQSADQRSDIFSFGAVLYEMLTGSRAFRGDSARDIIDKIVRSDPPPPETTTELRRIVMRCLNKDPAKRFQSIAELKVALSHTPVRKGKLVSVAVLPFANLSSNKENEYFSDGLTEEVINGLSHISGLRVTARTSAFAFRKRHEDVRKIAESLDVQAILEGSVRQSGNRIRVTAQLINAADGFHLWSQRYDRELADVFEIQDDISHAIAKALKVRLFRGSTCSFSAYEAYLKARYYTWQLTPQSLSQSLEYYEQAIALDPEFELAHCGNADSYLARGLMGIIPADEAIAAARTSAHNALYLNPSLPEANAMLGAIAMLYDNDWQEADRRFELAMITESVSSVVHILYGYFYLLLKGQVQDAIAELHRALREDPLNATLHFMVAMCFLVTGTKEQALRQLQEALELNQRHVWSMVVLALDYSSNGMNAEALVWAERATSVADWDPVPAGLLAALLVRVGESTRANNVMEHLHDGHFFGPALGLVVFHLVTGEMDKAAGQLQRAMDEHCPIGSLIHLLNCPIAKTLLFSAQWPALAKAWPMIQRILTLQTCPAAAHAA